jgi:hypothetical protein
MKFEDYNKNNVFFQDPIANTIFDNSHFIRINYSNHLFMLNCIILEFNLSLQNIENYFNKYKYTYNVKTNIIPITSLIKLEKEILDKLSIKNKKPLFNLNQQLKDGKTKIGVIFNTDPHTKDGSHWVSLFINIKKMGNSK